MIKGNAQNPIITTQRLKSKMIDPPLILTERTCFSDECYGGIGRSLAFATSFECNCWSLEALIKMSGALDFQDETSMKRFCRELDKKFLGRRMEDITKTFKNKAEIVAECEKVALKDEKFGYDTIKGKDLSDIMEYSVTKLGEKFEDARKARNIIAHDLTKGIEHRADVDERRQDLIKDVEELVRRIAKADVVVYNILRILTQEPTFKDADKYCEAAVRWVCEIEDSP